MSGDRFEQVVNNYFVEANWKWIALLLFQNIFIILCRQLYFYNYFLIEYKNVNICLGDASLATWGARCGVRSLFC